MQYITERDGVVVDRRVEKRQTRVTTVEANEEDVDYDQVRAHVYSSAVPT